VILKNDKFNVEIVKDIQAYKDEMMEILIAMMADQTLE